MPTFDDINDFNTANVRKALSIVLFVAPMSSTVVSAITDASGALVALPAGYEPFGLITPDGITWPRETEASDTFALGVAEPVRSDVKRAIKRLTVVPMETNRVVLGEFLGMDLSEVETSTGGESSWDEPDIPNFLYRRVIAISKDINDGGEYFRGQHFPRARVTATNENVWNDADSGTTYGMTWTAFNDAAVGTATRHFLGGQGRNPVDEGFPAAPGS